MIDLTPIKSKTNKDAANFLATLHIEKSGIISIISADAILSLLVQAGFKIEKI